MNHETGYTAKCQWCHQEFEAVGTVPRKYCGVDCQGRAFTASRSGIIPPRTGKASKASAQRVIEALANVALSENAELSKRARRFQRG